ncbi:MAG: dual specificity protein phosphatase family protein [Candidatus Omnitrophota bacterium]
MRKLILLAAILFLCIGACLADKPYDNIELTLPRDIFNFHIVDPGVMRGSQPSAKTLKALKEYYGVKTVLSLHNDVAVNKWEQRVVEELGMEFINIPLDASLEQKPQTIEQAIEILGNKDNQPIFAHCKEGKDRTGLILAAYRIKYDNWSQEEALMEMHAYGYNPLRYPNLKDSLSYWDDWRKGRI